MTTLDKLLGIKPTELEVEKLFNKRKLKLREKNSYCLIEENNNFYESGNYQTKSKTKKMAMMKYEILIDEIVRIES